MGCADLKFKGLNFSVNIVDALIGCGGFVEKVKEDRDEDESSDKRVEHRQV
jgi:hypothetical protein